MAVTAGRSQTEVRSHGNFSVIHRAIDSLGKAGFRWGKDLYSLNGEMGKNTAQTLRERGADVTVTVRQYRSGIVNIPVGCKRINYGERMEYLPKCDLVVSATASPNYTLRTDLFKDTVLERPVVIIDLAVPRDVEPELSKMEQVTLYDMDSFKAEALGEEQRESLHRAGAIVHEQMEEFYQWLDGRDVIPRIQEIKMDAVNDLNLRIAKILKATPMEEKDRERLIQVIDTAAGKVVNKMIFGLRDTLE
ncbi:MAG: glutamyl-tRNA reductase, partial [Blautia sp.]